MKTYKKTNRVMADSGEFRKLCQEVGVNATVRQASKYRNGKGRAWTYRNTMREMNE